MDSNSVRVKPISSHDRAVILCRKLRRKQQETIATLESRKKRSLTRTWLLLVCTLIIISKRSETATEAFVPTYIGLKNQRGKNGFDKNSFLITERSEYSRVSSRFAATVNSAEEDNELMHSFPSLPAEIKRVGTHSKTNYQQRERRRRKKEKQQNISDEKNKCKMYGSTPKQTRLKVKPPSQMILPDQIPKLSQILENSSASKEENERTLRLDRTMTEAKNREEDQRKKLERNSTRKRSKLTKTNTVPWRASFKSSKRTQGRIQKAFLQSSDRKPHSRAEAVLDILLQTPPQYCNSVNLVCALTYSAKAMVNTRVDEMEINLGFRTKIQEIFDILYDLLVIHRDEGLFSPRQLCNVAWAIAKHCDRYPDLLVSQEDKHEMNREFKPQDSPQLRLEESIDEIAIQLTSILFNDRCENQTTQSSFLQPRIKLGEICMACWAYGKLRHRDVPPGWPGPPQIGTIKNNDSVVDYWKTEELGTTVRFGADSFEGNENHEKNEYDNRNLSDVTDLLFDAIGYALCENLNSNDPRSILLQNCSWSELANVGWAFASHGRCRSMESEMLLKKLTQEAVNRLKEDGAIANNGSYQNFLVRDITQLLWSLGTLQSDNFRLADDLVLLVEALTANLRLGMRKGSSFAQGRPLRRWSCADLVQTSVALAHARIDEKLLLRAIYEESVHRLMEGASSGQNWSSSIDSTTHQTLNSNNNLLLGEDRRTFHPWEASILLWAQARLFLTKQEGSDFDEFSGDVPVFFLNALRKNRGSFEASRIGHQEQANIVWSLVILEKYDSPEAMMLIDLIFTEAARFCERNKVIQLEHAHQLWQAYFILAEDCPEAVRRVPEWFVSYLKEKWSLEKARLKLSSARHRSLSSVLDLMGVSHINEHDEDIDVAIILKADAEWVHETNMDEENTAGYNAHESSHLSVAIEFDGPNHFTRVRSESHPSTTTSSPRALGHTVLKYRLLKKQGWTVVRIPYYEFDKIPFWASMERQRYLQRKLKTHANIQFSQVDISEYKTLTPNRKSRFD